MPLVSVIMPVYNGEKFLAEAIESILAQTFTDFELIIVDDGSTDGSVAIIRDCEKRDIRVRSLRFERNMGAAQARNRGLDAARGEFVTGMDCDDISLPQRLGKQVAYLQAHPEIGALGVSAQVVYQDLSPENKLGMPRTHPHIAFNIPLGWSIIGASVMMRRDLVTAVGGYDPRYRVGDDMDLAARLICRTRYANLPDYLYLWRRHDRQIHGTDSAKKAWNDLLHDLYSNLWGEVPAGTLDRVADVRSRERLGWAKRRAIKRDMKRLIDSMIQANWIQPEEKTILYAEMNRRLERMSPRPWQMFCHWRRHRFGR